MAPTKALQQQLFEEMKARIKEDDSSVPSPDGPFAYYQRYENGGQHPVFCRRPVDSEAGEEVLLDGNRKAAGASYFRVASCAPSPDHQLLAYAIARNGSARHPIHFNDLATGRPTPSSTRKQP